MQETTEWLRVPAAEPQGFLESLCAERNALDNRLEMPMRLAALQGREHPALGRVSLAVFAADSGHDFGGGSPLKGAAAAAADIASGKAALCRLAQRVHARVEVIDLGMSSDPGPLPNTLSLRLSPGIADSCEAPAMTRHQLARAVHAGRHAAERAKLAGCDLFIGGAIGTGHAAGSAALACSLLGLEPDGVWGFTGLGQDLDWKRIGRALGRHARHDASPLEGLRRLGSFASAALSGAYMACAHMGLPFAVDGFVSAVAALNAARLCRGAERWLLFAQGPRHLLHEMVLEALPARTLEDSRRCSEDGAEALASVALL